MRRVDKEAERQARREADRQRSIASIEALRSSEGWRAWLSSRRHFHRYSLANQLLIAMQCPDATMVAGFRAWLKLGYCVRRGERAIRIWVPMPPSKQAIDAWRAAGADPEEKPRMRFRLGPVFDRSQVYELPPPAEPANLDCPIHPVEGDELEWCLAPLVSLAGEIGSTVSFTPLAEECGGTYDPCTRAIEVNSSYTPNGQALALVHEDSHALVRAEPGQDDPKLSYADEELVVESVAFTVCGSVGLDVSGASIPYLAAWSEQASVETIHAAAGMIDRYARRIEDALEAARPEGQRDDEGKQEGDGLAIAA